MEGWDIMGRQSERRVPILHVYGQETEHDEIRIVGNDLSLLTLSRALLQAVLKGTSETDEVYATDGEGYTIKVTLNNEDWQSDSWQGAPLPYSRINAPGTPASENAGIKGAAETVKGLYPLALFAMPGTKVVFTGVGADEFHRRRAIEHLKVGKEYTLESVEIRPSFTEVFLREVPDEPFDPRLFVVKPCTSS